MAFDLIVSLLHAKVWNLSSAPRRPATVGSSKRIPVCPETTVSREPPRPKAIDGGPAGLGLERGDAEILLAGKKESGRPAIEAPEVLGARRPEELHVRPGALPEGLVLGTGADDLQRGPRAVEGLDREVDPLVRDEGRNDQMVIPAGDGFVRREEPRVHGRRDDVGLAPVVFPDPPGDVGRVGHEAVHPRGGGRVPGPQIDGRREE